MVDVVKSATFERWFLGLRDRQAQALLTIRLRLSLGNLGDVKPIGGGLSELRIDHGPGYRVYLLRRGGAVVVLLCGGTKGTQDADIKRAKAIAAQWKE